MALSTAGVAASTTRGLRYRVSDSWVNVFYRYNDIILQMPAENGLMGSRQAYNRVVPPTRWGIAIATLLHERGWTQKQLASAAQLRPNTLTSIIRHGGETDTRTLRRIARVLDVDLAELLMNPEQRLILQTHRERTIERITASVVDQIRETVGELVRSELARAGVSTDLTDTLPSAAHRPPPERERMPVERVAAERERSDVGRDR